ncbi:MAG: ABC transporter substrate-binding protein [Oscillospiraceae bacterium]|jgi:peptide/nickel transport system substrate-binding protein|nr:ABC transporter substrate-binding protein [Oscillospiraceae bacterium]
MIEFIKRISVKRAFHISFACIFIFAGSTASALEYAPPPGIQRGTQLTVGSVTELNGCFSTDLWGTNTADMDVRDLLHGYHITTSHDKETSFNPTVVSRTTRRNEENGALTYEITIQPGLTYNDGSPITARDFVFSMLLQSSPIVKELGGVPLEYNHIQGIEEYISGDTVALSGLHLISQYTYSITIKPEYRVYFYDVARLNAVPLPIQIIAPGCDIADDVTGAYIARGDEADSLYSQALNYTPGLFSKEMLESTFTDRESGYLYYPRITSGPYQLESYDPESHVARFLVNERYLGNPEGVRPKIERLVYKRVDNATMLEELQNGSVDILNKVTNESVIKNALSLSINSSEYQRTGFAFLSFACEEGVASSVNVRRAIAHCIDKQAFVRESLSNIAIAAPVYGYYGVGQWMPHESYEYDPQTGSVALDMAAELAELEVPLNLEEAERLLTLDGWTLNKEGQAWRHGDGTRYRMEESILRPLVIRWAKPEGNIIADALESVIHPAFEQIGVELTVDALSFELLYKHFIREIDRTYDMFFLANEFYYVYDPAYEFGTDDLYQGSINVTGLRDAELMWLALEMGRTQPGANREYIEEFLRFQQRFVELMPMVPLYSNIYYDFYDSRVHGYNIEQSTSWALAIPGAWTE